MAVYTEISDDELVRFIAGYDIGSLSACKGIAEGVENTNYFVQTTQGPFILTLYEQRVAPQDLPFFLGLMEHLAGKGVSCPTPVHDRSGRLLSELAGKTAVLVNFLDGVWIKRPTAAHCAAVGIALARLHDAGAGFALTRPNALGLNGWQPLYARLGGDCNRVADGLAAVIETELATLVRDFPHDLPSGVIHADLFPDNVFFLAERLSGLIDFYFSCNDALAYDIAICLNAWCFEPDFAFNITKGRALLRGYESVRTLTVQEREAMPVLARGAAMRFLLTRTHDWLNPKVQALVKPHDPIDYLRRLRFHQSVRSIVDYGGA